MAQNEVNANNAYNQVSINSLPPELMQTIFSYLTLKEAFRYETVCKKWQQMIFSNQKEINLWKCFSAANYYYNGCIEIKNYYDFKEWLKVTLKKCPNIKKINFKFYQMNAEEIQVLIDLCPNLDDVQFMIFNEWDEKKYSFGIKKSIKETQQNLIQKYGHQLKRANIEIKARWLKSCLRLREVYRYNFHVFRDHYFPHLIETRVNLRMHEDLDDFRSFVELYCNQLKSLQLFAHEYDTSITKASLQEVAKFIHLETFSLRGDSLLLHELTEIIPKCKNLRKFKVYMSVDFDKLLKDIHLFLPNLTFIKLNGDFTDTTLRHLAQLKNLNTLILNADEDSYSEELNLSELLITDSAVCHVLNSCHSIQRMQLYCKMSITHVTISKWIQLASKNPGFRYIFIYKNDKRIHETLQNNIPSNLFMKHTTEYLCWYNRWDYRN